VPSPEAARKFLYQFHHEEKIERAQAELPDAARLQLRSLPKHVRRNVGFRIEALRQDLADDC